MIATATLAGAPFTSHSLEVLSWPQRTEVRIEVAQVRVDLGDELVLTFDGERAIVAHVHSAARRIGHAYLVAEPLVCRELRADAPRQVGPMILDERTAGVIAAELLQPAMTQVAPALDIALARWTTRERAVAWAWASFLRTLAGQTGAAVSWRHDARANAVLVEADRSAWTPRRMPEPTMRNEQWATYEPAVPVQAGDVIDGQPVVHAHTQLSPTMHLTRVRTVAPADRP